MVSKVAMKIKMSDLSLKTIKEEYEIARQKDEAFDMESFLKRNEEKLQKVKEWKKHKNLYLLLKTIQFVIKIISIKKGEMLWKR